VVCCGSDITAAAIKSKLVETGPINDIIEKFLAGTCSDEEFAYLLYWYESFDEQDIPAMAAGEKEMLRVKLLDQMRANIPALNNRPRVAGRVRLLVILKKTWPYAAAAVMLALVTWTFFGRGTSNALPGQGYEPGGSRNRIVIFNQSERIHAVLLPDSSRVWLDPGSKLVYPEKFLGPERLVHLTGEGFFDIAPDPVHPFKVASGRLVTRVLGTSFLITAYRGRPAEVAVMSGRVSVSSADGGGAALILNAREKGVFDSVSRQFRKSDVEKRLVSRWQKADLSFNNTPFSEVATRLERQFDIRIQLKDAQIAGYMLNADFNNQDLNSILEILEKSLNIRYEIDNDSLVSLYDNIDINP
jgi:ferric-dicitrate binding protein FerR (iron transport regulator)